MNKTLLVRDSAKNLIRNKKGQSMLEYIIISGLIGIFCLVSMKQLGQVLTARTQNLKKKIVEEISL